MGVGVEVGAVVGTGVGVTVGAVVGAGIGVAVGAGVGMGVAVGAGETAARRASIISAGSDADAVPTLSDAQAVRESSASAAKIENIVLGR